MVVIMGSIFMEEDEWLEVLWHLVIVIDLTHTDSIGRIIHITWSLGLTLMF